MEFIKEMIVCAFLWLMLASAIIVGNKIYDSHFKDSKPEVIIFNYECEEKTNVI